MNFKKLYYTECQCPMAVFPLRVHMNGMKVVIPIESGPVEGELIKGNIIKLGADWNHIQFVPFASDVRAKYRIVTDDGASIDLFTDGRMKLNWKTIPDALKRHSVNLADYLYFREHLYFQTADERYSWLNTAPCFAVIGMKIKLPYFLICYNAYVINP